MISCGLCFVIFQNAFAVCFVSLQGIASSLSHPSVLHNSSWGWGWGFYHAASKQGPKQEWKRTMGACHQGCPRQRGTHHCPPCGSQRLPSRTKTGYGLMFLNLITEYWLNLLFTRHSPIQLRGPSSKPDSQGPFSQSSASEGRVCQREWKSDFL